MGAFETIPAMGATAVLLYVFIALNMLISASYVIVRGVRRLTVAKRTAGAADHSANP
ncbi:MAG: hypothetical protein AAGD92_00120 [Pseudomonadota bacterium]